MQIITDLFKLPVLICTIPFLLKTKTESKFPVRQTIETQNQFKVHQKVVFLKNQNLHVRQGKRDFISKETGVI
jgi:hypothetical protein